MEPGSRACNACGQPVTATVETDAEERPQQVSSLAPADYVPYCRSCGVGVPWGQGHACRRCGVSPLCALHFRAAANLCLDCAFAPAYSGVAAVARGLTCGACGAAVSPEAGFCPRCGQVRSTAPAAPSDAVEYMGFWIRAAAFVADRIITYVIAALIAAVIGISRTAGDAEPVPADQISVSFDTINFNFLLLLWGVSVVYSVLLTGLWGQTLGKMLLRIQVVDANGNTPPWHRVVARELVGRFVSEVALWLGYAWIGFDRRNRGWHDYLGGSYVVRKRRDSRTGGGL